MSWLNRILVLIFDLIQAPFEGLPPLVGVAFWGVIIGVAALYVVKWTSNQEGIERAKRFIGAGLLEMRLFNDDLRALFSGLGQVLAQTGVYMFRLLVPLVYMMIPIVLWYGQLDGFYGLKGLEPGKPALLKVQLAEGSTTSRPQLSVKVPEGLRLESKGLWIPSANEMDWRLSAEREGDFTLQVVKDGVEHAKTVTASSRPVRRSPRRDRSWFSQVLYPSEPPLEAAAGIESIQLTYPEEGDFLGAHKWSWIFVLFTLVIGVLIKDRIGVTL